jgi:peroxiredoxin
VKIAADHRGDGLLVLGVTDASVDETLAFLDEEQLPFAILADAAGAREAWEVGVIWGSPSYLVDADDRIVAEEVLSLSAGEFAELLGR